MRKTGLTQVWGLRLPDLAIAMSTMVAIIVCGCAKPPTTPPSTKTGLAVNQDSENQIEPVGQSRGDGANTPRQIVADSDAPQPIAASANSIGKLLESYEGLNSYQDETVMSLTYQFDDGRKEVDTTRLTTKFAKPNQLNLRVASEDNRVMVVSDGRQMVARIFDPVTKDFDSQAVIVDTPEKLSVADLYKLTELVDPVSPNEMISALLGAPTGIDMTPLGLLLNDGGLVELLQSDIAARSLGNQSLDDGTTCEVFLVTETPNADNGYRIWVDQGEQLLRRIEFPQSTENLPAGLARMELVAESNRIQTTLDGSNHFDVNGLIEKTQKVSHFVLPPLPPPTDLIGKQVKRLTFRGSRQVQVENAEREIAVLTWFHNHPASRLVVEQLEAVRKRVASPRVKFVNIFVEPATTSTNSIEAIKDWTMELPPVRDPDAMGLNVLGVKQAPTTVILGPKNTVHYFEVGANPNIANNVSLVVERLLSDQDVAKDTLSLTRRVHEAYKRQLTMAKASDSWVEQVEAEIPKATKPEKLTLEKAWSTKEVTEPGNMLIVPGKKKQILITDGWNQLVMLDSNGKVGRRIPLEIPSDAGITLLRAGKDKRDRGLIAAATPGGRRVFLFDFAGKLVMQYPRIPDERSAISDMTIGDIDGDKEPELVVAWQGNIGVHGVSLDGKQRWINRVMPGVVSTSLVPKKNGKSVLIAGEMGTPFLIDADGRTIREVTVGPVALHRIVSWPGSARGFDPLVAPASAVLADDLGTHCAFTLSPTGEMTAVGINKKWKGLWEYSLPPGVYRHQVDWPQSLVLPKIGATWLMPGADGSVHFVSADGEVTDSFFLGKHIRGVAGMNVGDEQILLVATDGEVTAFRVSDDAIEK